MKLRIRNWSKFQHYNDRNPPWIKIYNTLLNDPDWFELPGDAAKTLVNCWMIASTDGLDGKLPDSRTLAFRLHLDIKVLAKHISLLNHWLESDASEALAPCLQLAPPETETETKTETETETKTETKKRPTPSGLSATQLAQFERFYEVYPRKEARARALIAFPAALTKVSFDILLAATKDYAQRVRGEDQKFTALPASWLNGERWNDQPTKLVAKERELPPRRGYTVVKGEYVQLDDYGVPMIEGGWEGTLN